ncbi:MAG: PD-(D/E)XK nuclease family protein [Flavobacteriales bacterium]|nr:PD-(D/E)XK nuclease family protein [Flavobacteriales bacterium]
MPRFLERLADLLLERHADGLDHVAVVLPSRRAGLHLRKYLAVRSGKPLWSPEILDPGAFLARVANRRQGNPLELLLRLHEVHQRLSGPNADGLDEFLTWAPATLRDMGEVDAHLLDAASVYRDLRAYHEIEAWSFLGSADLSQTQHRALAQWKHTGELHAAFAEDMALAGMGTAGSVARAASQAVKQPDWSSPWRYVWFAGLNALEPAMVEVLRSMIDRNLGQMAWDTDRFYLDDSEHEAGRFLRRASADLGHGAIEPMNTIRELDRCIEVTTVSDTAAMAQHAAEWVMALSPEERDDAAIVLADEGLLLPVLEALPSGIGPVNVTMGVALEALPIHGLERSFLHLHEHLANTGAISKDGLIKLLTHPMLDEGESTRRLIQGLKGQSLQLASVLNAGEQAGLRSILHLRNALFGPTDAWDITARMQDLLAWALEVKRDDRLAREQLYQLAIAGRRVDAALRQSGPSWSGLAAYRVIRERASRQLKLPLFGEPLAGLQIMGVLETRALDHSHVLLLGANEGVLGGGEAPSSWIPFDLRRHHRLPLQADSDAVTSYHVHRMLHHAKHFGMVLVSGAEQDKGPSRFIAQWRHGLAEGSNTRIVDRTRLAPLVVRKPVGIAVDKTPFILDRLRALTARGLSPTALTTWLGCPLDFHTRYVLGISDTRLEEQRLGTDVLGNAVHVVLEGLLRPTMGQALPGEYLRGEIPGVPERLNAALRREGLIDEVLAKGHHRLVTEMGAKAIARYLAAEADRCAREPTEVKALETFFTGTVGQDMNLRGKFDRLETRGGLMHLLDLKTGRVDEGKLRISSWEREGFTTHHKQALQLICYATMAFQSDSGLDAIKAGIIPLRTKSQHDGAWLQVNGDSVIQRSELPAMEQLVRTLILEMLDPTVPFRHNPESRYCLVCTA